MSDKLKGNVDTYLDALEDEIERVKHQRNNIPYSHSEYLKSWDEYITHLESLRVEACLLMEFEDEEDSTQHIDTKFEVTVLGDEADE